MIPIDFKDNGQRSRSYLKSGNHRIIKQTLCQIVVRLIDVCSIGNVLTGLNRIFSIDIAHKLWFKVNLFTAEISVIS